MGTHDTVAEMLRQKLIIMHEFLSITQQELLLVDLEELTPLLERKDVLIREIKLIDETLALHDPPPSEHAKLREELTGVVEAILENEAAMEERILEAQSRLRQEMRGLDQETRLKRYLERAKTKGGTVNLKQ